MTLDEIKEHFVLYSNAMRQVGLTRHAYLNWRRVGYIPYYQQVKFEKITNGKLKANINDKKERGHGTREAARHATMANQRRAGTLKDD